MKDETRTWLRYADENLDVARLALENGYFNACLQNCQQAVEKYLKSIILERNFEFRRTHSIQELLAVLRKHEVVINISEDEIDLMDAIYLPSKYPIYGALPFALPDRRICEVALETVEKVGCSVIEVLNTE